MLNISSCIAVGLLLCGYGVLALEAAEETFLKNGVTAHRGNSGEFPENTIPAFKNGIEAGADWIELDVLLTNDGRLVVSHDATTGRVGDQSLEIARSDYQQLLTVDVATDFRKRHNQTIQACPPGRIPLLQDVLELVVQQHRTRVSIQPKMDCVGEIISLVRKRNAENWVGFNDGNLEWMSEVKRLAPAIPVFWDRGPQTNIDEDIKIVKMKGFESLIIRADGLTIEKVQKIQAAGLQAGAWTVNNVEEMSRLLKIGVDRIYTDYPQRLLELQLQRQK